VTVESAAAAKIFFECHYNKILSGDLTPRSLRRLQLESALSENCTFSPADKDDIRRVWAKQETDHLRETRVMRVRGASALKGKDIASSSFETIKILGKGSFGVVRLVRERSENGYVVSLLTAFKKPAYTKISTDKLKEIYAMKVIRKSDMLRNSQEGHLRAERDFLVAAEGSRW
jgi:protein-serine/threonine kinase